MLKALFRDILTQRKRSAGAAAVDKSAPTVPSPQRAGNPLDVEIPLLGGTANPRQPIDYERVAYYMAAWGSARYLTDNMATATNFPDSRSLMTYALEQAKNTGLVLEFGVFRGDSLRLMAQHAGQRVHGFDSFEGLPEDWTYFQKKGRFSLNGIVPVFSEKNIELHPGWFDQSLPKFLLREQDMVRLLHIDCDLYSSTVSVLAGLRERICAGTIVVFDEYLNYPSWEQHEYKAFAEFAKRWQCTYEYIGFVSSGHAVALRINSIAAYEQQPRSQSRATAS